MLLCSMSDKIEPPGILEEFAMRYPILLEKCLMDDIYVGQGWIPIIDNLFSVIVAPYEKQKWYLTHSDVEEAQKFKEQLEYEKSELPIITQIKQKYAGLTIYGRNCNSRVKSLFDFAAAQASITCEICGDKGEAENAAGFECVLCPKHYQEELARSKQYKF